MLPDLTVGFLLDLASRTAPALVQSPMKTLDVWLHVTSKTKKPLLVAFVHEAPAAV